MFRATGAEEPARPAEGSPKAAPARAIALQRSAGNKAVRSLLRPGFQITTSVERGALSPSMPRRRDELLLGDRLVVRVKARGFRRPSRSVTPVYTSKTSTALVPEVQGWEGDTYVWKIRPRSTGTFPLEFLLGWGPAGEGRPVRRFARTIRVITEAESAWKLIDIAKEKVDSRFLAAERSLLLANMAYKRAYDQHLAELKSAEANERLDEDLALALMVFALTGFTSGAVYAAIKPAFVPAMASTTWVSSTLRTVGPGRVHLPSKASTIIGEGFAAAAAGLPSGAVRDIIIELGLRKRVGTPAGKPITDLGEGILKYALREAGEVKRQGGDRAPVPEVNDPLGFLLGLQAELTAEHKLVADAFIALREDVLWKSARWPRARFADDIRALATVPSALLDALPALAEVEWKAWYEALWGAWVRSRYYRIEYQAWRAVHPKGDGVPYQVRTAGSRINQVLRGVAATCGYRDMQRFVDRYSDREALEKERARLTHRYWHGKD